MTETEAVKATVSKANFVTQMVFVLIFVQNGQSEVLLAMVMDQWVTVQTEAFAIKTVLVRVVVPNLSIMEKVEMVMGNRWETVALDKFATAMELALLFALRVKLGVMLVMVMAQRKEIVKKEISVIVTVNALRNAPQYQNLV